MAMSVESAGKCGVLSRGERSKFAHMNESGQLLKAA
jgi:hypothetical protein